jgi:predicted transcriptional regulator
MPDTTLKRINTHMDQQHVEQLDELAELTMVTRATHIRIAIRQYLKRELGKARAAAA